MKLKSPCQSLAGMLRHNAIAPTLPSTLTVTREMIVPCRRLQKRYLVEKPISSSLYVLLLAQPLSFKRGKRKILVGKSFAEKKSRKDNGEHSEAVWCGFNYSESWAKCSNAPAPTPLYPPTLTCFLTMSRKEKGDKGVKSSLGQLEMAGLESATPETILR